MLYSRVESIAGNFSLGSSQRVFIVPAQLGRFGGRDRAAGGRGGEGSG